MKVLFLCAPYQAPDKALFQHGIVVLAEGMREHGWTFKGNIDYWPEESRYLIEKAPAGFEPELVIASHQFAEANPNEPLLNGAVLIDLADGYHTLATDPNSDRYLRVLRSHYHPDLPYRSNVRPWFFGLANRIMESVDRFRRPVPFKTKAILSNFRVAHEIRDFALFMLRKRLAQPSMATHLAERLSDGQTGTQLTGADLRHWQHTGRRHDPAFYNYLNDYAMTLVFGGFLWEKPGIQTLPSPIKSMAKLALLKVLKKPSAYYTLFNWDSWRMWEAFFSGTIPVHFDLAAWGCKLPVMPEAGQHYLGVGEYDFAGLIDLIERMHPDELAAISEAGTVFARQHYGPAATVGHLQAALQSQNPKV